MVDNCRKNEHQSILLRILSSIFLVDIYESPTYRSTLPEGKYNCHCWNEQSATTTLWYGDSNEVLNNKEAISSHRSDLLADKEELCGDKCHAGRLVPGTMVQETGFNLMKFQLKVFSINFSQS